MGEEEIFEGVGDIVGGVGLLFIIVYGNRVWWILGLIFVWWKILGYFSEVVLGFVIVCKVLGSLDLRRFEEGGFIFENC